MAKRVKIGIIYSYDEGWIAGSYYILNLIHSLNLLEDNVKPELVILTTSIKEFDSLRLNTKYPYLHFKKLEDADIWGSNYYFYERIINKIYRVFTGKNLINRLQTYKRLSIDIDFLFPASDHIYFSKIKNKLFWIPDFQEHFLPHFFTERSIADRKKYQQKLVESSETIVFSSHNALQHFKNIYPDSTSKTFVLQFAVTHSQFENIEISALLEKFKISGPYFFCPNQFWQHKNHMVVLKAITYLKEKGNTDILVAFSGKENDPRNPGYFGGLKKYIKEKEIENQVKFLGFIDRAEQLQIMNNAICVIQPSLFEGWSTVIEDAKAMNQYVIASGIEVHKEQLEENRIFFDPNDYIMLAEIIERYSVAAPPKVDINYEKQKLKFGRTFIDILRQAQHG